MDIPQTLKLGLALSGGGYRAAAFHLGTLRTLDNLNILNRLHVLSTVSGGSIIGADFALNKDKKPYQQFEADFVAKLRKSVIWKVITSPPLLIIGLATLAWLASIIAMQFTAFPWVSWIILVAGIVLLVTFQFKILPVSTIIENIYNRIFFNHSHLRDLPPKPVIAINSTNLQTGTPFTFSRHRMGDSNCRNPDTGQIIRFKPDRFPVARAVMASSCVPFAFTPVPIAKTFFANPADATIAHPTLIDGGVYDNQGIHKLTFAESDYRADIVIVSDAGDNLPFKNQWKNVIALLIRTMDLFMYRIKNFQKMDNLYQPGRDKKRQIAYISLGWDLDRCIPGFVDNLRKRNIPHAVLDAHRIPQAYLNPFNAEKIEVYLKDQVGYAQIISRQQPPAQLKLARSVGTNLTALSLEQIHALINQAELMTELQVKLYCPAALPT